MDKNLKHALLVIAAVFIGLGLFRLGQWYFVMHEVDRFTAEVQQDVQKITAKSQQKLEASRRESARRYAEQQAKQEQQRKERDQKALEANLLCAASIDTGRCSCYDKRTNMPVSMEPEVCMDYVKRQVSSN